MRAPGLSLILEVAVPGTSTTAVAVSPSGAVTWYGTSRGAAFTGMVSEAPWIVTPAGAALILRSPGDPAGSYVVAQHVDGDGGRAGRGRRGDVVVGDRRQLRAGHGAHDDLRERRRR